MMKDRTRIPALPAALLAAAVMLAACPVSGAYEDTVCFLQPRHGALLDRDLIKIAVPAVIAGDAVNRVSFRARYSQYTSNKMAHSRVESDLGTDSVPPFEILWDCSRVPDQDMTNLHFMMSYVTAAGETVAAPSWSQPACVLDRHPEPNPAEWTAVRSQAVFRIDGILDEWAGIDSVTFANNDNVITARAAWNDSGLYFGIRVEDTRLYPPDSVFRDTDVATFYKDGLEIFLDLDHTRTVTRTQRDYQVMMSLDGEVVPVVYDVSHTPNDERNAQARLEELPDSVRLAMREPNYVPATAFRRIPGGYVAEAALSWAGLKVRNAAAGLTMGFNLVNSDREEGDGVVVTGSWAGISDLLHHNPSEWGTLRLAGSGWSGPAAVAGGVLVLLAAAGGAVYARKRKGPGTVPAEPLTTQELVIKTVRDFVEQNIGDEGLDLKKAAAYVDLSPDYLRQLFKKVTDENFSVYLNKVRLEKSRRLLAGTNKRITEIAFESGFSTYQNFNRVFKEAEGVSPSEYRKRNYDR